MGDAVARASSESRLRQAGMTAGARAKRPMEFALGLHDTDMVDARLASSHQAVVSELPLLIAMGAIPIAAVVMPFIGKANSNPVAVKSPHLLDQTVVELALPFAGQKRLDRIAAFNELGAISPAAVGCVGKGHAFRIARVPGVLRHARLLSCGLGSERRKGRARHSTRFRTRSRAPQPLLSKGGSYFPRVPVRTLAASLSAYQVSSGIVIPGARFIRVSAVPGVMANLPRAIPSMMESATAVAFHAFTTPGVSLVSAGFVLFSSARSADSV